MFEKMDFAMCFNRFSKQNLAENLYERFKNRKILLNWLEIHFSFARFRDSLKNGV